jgi:hypothetical protein
VLDSPENILQGTRALASAKEVVYYTDRGLDWGLSMCMKRKWPLAGSVLTLLWREATKHFRYKRVNAVMNGVGCK